MDVVQTVAGAPAARLIGADVVELIPSAHAPGCDIVAARLVAKMLGFWHIGKTKNATQK
jgi:hypothetical protein